MNKAAALQSTGRRGMCKWWVTKIENYWAYGVPISGGDERGSSRVVRAARPPLDKHILCRVG